ncbi:hypothetical protein EDB83DRAFT_2356736 [Lactarius deliciosus]|nr:hypothetical protein EDB83DRAFT_2356736 [Lactarius deliciosus]
MAHTFGFGILVWNVPTLICVAAGPPEPCVHNSIRWVASFLVAARPQLRGSQGSHRPDWHVALGHNNYAPNSTCPHFAFGHISTPDRAGIPEDHPQRRTPLGSSPPFRP